jgi:hypothetical protein
VTIRVGQNGGNLQKHVLRGERRLNKACLSEKWLKKVVLGISDILKPISVNRKTFNGQKFKDTYMFPVFPETNFPFLPTLVTVDFILLRSLFQTKQLRVEIVPLERKALGTPA